MQTNAGYGPYFEQVDLIESVVQETLEESSDSKIFDTMESSKALANFINTPDDTINIVNTAWKSQFEELVPIVSSFLGEAAQT